MKLQKKGVDYCRHRGRITFTDAGSLKMSADLLFNKKKKTTASNMQARLTAPAMISTSGSSILEDFDQYEDEEEISHRVRENFDFRPLQIIRKLDLLRPIYSVTSAGGHFGREPTDGHFTWEQLDPEILASLQQS